MLGQVVQVAKCIIGQCGTSSSPSANRHPWRPIRVLDYDEDDSEFTYPPPDKKVLWYTKGKGKGKGTKTKGTKGCKGKGTKPASEEERRAGGSKAFSMPRSIHLGQVCAIVTPM